MRKYHTHITLIFLACILYVMANFQRVSIPGAIFDTLQADLQANAPTITSFGATFMYTYAFSLLAIGMLVDRFSGVKVILWGGSLFALGALIFPNTTCLPLLYFSRMLLGAGAACFYLSLVQEVKKCFPDKYFGISVSLMLITGYMGGVCANAPFIIVAHAFSWQAVMNVLAIITLVVVLAYAFVLHFLHGVPQNEHVHFSLEPFKEVLSKHFNRNLYMFAGLNYGLYYVIQTVIGVKFLKDFVNLSATQASVALSIMVVIAGISGLSLATLSKLCNNRRVIFMKSVCLFTTTIFAIIFLCLLFDIRTHLIVYMLMLVAIGGGMSPLLVPIIHGTNKYEVRGTALSIMNCCFFLSVGILASLVGVLLDVYAPVSNSVGHLVYSNKSYMLVFGTFILFSFVEMYNVFKLKDVE